MNRSKTFVGNANDGRHYWITPPELYAQLDAEFHFDFDPCPYPCPWTFDGLREEWGSCSYVNPPFASPTRWVRKSIEQQHEGKRVVFVFPVDKWLLRIIAAASEIRNLGDVRWLSTEDGLPGPGTGRHIAMFVLEPK